MEFETEVARGGIRGCFENIIKKKQKQTRGYFTELRMDDERKM